MVEKTTALGGSHVYACTVCTLSGLELLALVITITIPEVCLASYYSYDCKLQ